MPDGESRKFSNVFDEKLKETRVYPTYSKKGYVTISSPSKSTIEIMDYGRTLTDKCDRILIEEVKNKCIKLIDSSTVSLCLNLFDWANLRIAKGGLKIHPVWDDKLEFPDYMKITEVKIHDCKGLISQVFPKGTIIVDDRAYFNFELIKKDTM